MPFRSPQLAWIVSVGAALALSVAPARAAEQVDQPGPAAKPQASSGSAEAPPQGSSIVDMNRIRRAVEREPAIDLGTDKLRFYSLITAPELDVSRLFGGDDFDFNYGPTRRGAAMTHDEFLAMVTPKELYGSGGIKPRELLEWSIINMVGQAIVKKLISELKDAKTERERREIREQIERELALIRGGNGGNGGGGL